MSDYTNNALFFLRMNKVGEAEKEVKKALSENPNDAYALALLASCKLSQKEIKEALSLAERAFSFAPDNSFVVYMLARAHYLNQDTDKARWAIQEGLKLAPDQSIFYSLLSQVEYYKENWALALEAAESGLEVDAENVDLINLRAQSLIKLNRKAEAAATMDYALHKAPEDSWSHSNRGWVSIERDQYDEAIEQFKEALRLDPTNQSAMAGLKEAIKGKNILYRIVLKYFLWMEKLQEKGRWGVVIGAYLIYRVVLALNRSYPEFSIFLVPIIAFYITFAFATWIGIPIANLFLRFHPLGKMALTKDERIGSIIVGAISLVALSFFVLSIISSTNQDFYFWVFVFVGIMLIPVGGLFAVTPKTNTRKGLIVYTLILAAIGIAYTLNIGGAALFYMWLIGIFAYQFVASYLISRDAKVLVRRLED